MKRFFYLTLLLFITACSSSDNDTIDGPDSGQPSLNLSETSVVLNTNASTTQNLTVKANGIWSAEITPSLASSWITVTPLSGESGDTPITIVIGENNTEEDRSATVTFNHKDGISEVFTVSQANRNYFYLEEQAFELTSDAASVQINLWCLQDTEYEVAITPETAADWITFKGTDIGPTNQTLEFEIGANSTARPRTADIEFHKGNVLRHSITISQAEGFTIEERADGSYIQLQKATKGNGVDLVFMGDGYTYDEVNVEGKYDIDLRASVEDFFSVYPYSRYRDHFNVYLMYAISNESGVTVTSTNTIVDTKFSCVMEGNSSGIDCDINLVQQWTESINELQDIEKTTAVVIINSPLYGGTCWMGPGFSISMCPRIENNSPNANARAVVIHEVGGHGFGKLLDEYRYTNPPYNEAPGRQEIRYVRSCQEYGMMMNIDFTDDLDEILWKDFLQYDKFTTDAVRFPVGAYQGGMVYSVGTWRPEENSCMNNNIDYYNAPSRWAIVKRIMDWGGVNYTFDDFVRDDDPPAPSYNMISPFSVGDEGFRPFGEPIIVIR